MTDAIEEKLKYSSSKTVYALQLKNKEIGDVYYKYDPSFEPDFELEVIGGMNIHKAFSVLILQKKRTNLKLN
ncbi:hypothetical protein KO02_23115 [Sphingobacterium sp. ML3W]|uniref:hypothetical protein n=1 Tax=Sphingobacterium sp. ML3W TaxID=1538644 RepID=UPI0004F5CCB8|nr:hypothetical protein [Sphingobacterium sp. ML3W]AIM39255.1 hypothetical protein KO02_23115 [Sphingobacterium sp. ML3W]